jgi:hypothetical protein
MHDHDKTIEVIIQSTRGSKKFSFLPQTKISDVINKAVSAFGFTPGDNFQLALASNPEEVLQPERTLVSYHIVDKTVLILTATGSGV